MKTTTTLIDTDIHKRAKLWAVEHNVTLRDALRKLLTAALALPDFKRGK